MVWVDVGDVVMVLVDWVWWLWFNVWIEVYLLFLLMICVEVGLLE